MPPTSVKLLTRTSPNKCRARGNKGLAFSTPKRGEKRVVTRVLNQNVPKTKTNWETTSIAVYNVNMFICILNIDIKIVSDVHDFLFYPIYSYLLVGNLVNSLFTLQYIFVFFKFNAHHDSKCSSWGIFEGYPPWNLAAVRKPSKKRKQSSSKHQFAGANCWFQHNNGNSPTIWVDISPIQNDDFSVQKSIFQGNPWRPMLWSCDVEGNLRKLTRTKKWCTDEWKKKHQRQLLYFGLVSSKFYEMFNLMNLMKSLLFTIRFSPKLTNQVTEWRLPCFENQYLLL